MSAQVYCTSTHTHTHTHTHRVLQFLHTHAHTHTECYSFCTHTHTHTQSVTVSAHTCIFHFQYSLVKIIFSLCFLFPEFVCPSLGFFEFLKKDYLDQILSWQMPSGCFGINSEKDSTLQVQSPQKLPPKMDLKKLGISDKLKNLSKVSSLDFRKQQMQQQLKNLKSSNQLIQSMLQIQDSERGRQDKDHQKHQKLNEEGVGDPWNPDQRRIKRLDFGDIKPQEAQLPHKRNPPKQQSPLDNPFHNVNARNRPQGNVPYRPQDSIPGKHQGIIPNRPQVDQAQVQGSWANNPQGVDAFGVQRMARSRDAAPVQGADSAGQVQKLQVRGAGQHPQHPSVSMLGNRLQGRRMLSAYETGQGTKRKLLVEKEMPGKKRDENLKQECQLPLP